MDETKFSRLSAFTIVEALKLFEYEFEADSQVGDTVPGMILSFKLGPHFYRYVIDLQPDPDWEITEEAWILSRLTNCRIGYDHWRNIILGTQDENMATTRS